MVTIITKNNCVRCKLTKRYLNAHHIAFEEHNVSLEPDYLAKVKALGYQAVPVVFSPQRSFVGFRPDQLAKL